MTDYIPRSVAADEMQDTYAVPTVVVNRFIASTTPTSFRVVFGESWGLGSTVHHRLGITMTPFEAWELKNLLESLLVPFKEQIEKSVSELEESTSAHEQQ